MDGSRALKIWSFGCEALAVRYPWQTVVALGLFRSLFLQKGSGRLDLLHDYVHKTINFRSGPSLPGSSRLSILVCSLAALHDQALCY